MSLVLCDDHRMFVDALAMALRSCDHDVVATCSDLQALPGVLQQAHPTCASWACSTAAGSGSECPGDDAGQSPGDLRARASRAGPRRTVWRLYDSGTIDGLVSKTVDLRTVDLAVRRVLAGEHRRRGPGTTRSGCLGAGAGEPSR
jgi:DNA-binding NarL/FixJ family response regulator